VLHEHIFHGCIFCHKKIFVLPTLESDFRRTPFNNLVINGGDVNAIREKALLAFLENPCDIIIR
jgi:hypothetical protein